MGPQCFCSYLFANFESLNRYQKDTIKYISSVSTFTELNINMFKNKHKKPVYMKLSIANNIMFKKKKKSSIFGTARHTHSLTSTNLDYDFQISKGGSHDFLFQKVSASTGTRMSIRLPVHILIHVCNLANSEDPEEMLHDESFHEDPHCLLVPRRSFER